MPFSVKVQVGNDIRRFTDVRSFEDLLSLVQERFGRTLRPWLEFHDSDGDVLKVSSSSELEECVSLSASQGRLAKFVALPTAAEGGWELLECEDGCNAESKKALKGSALDYATSITFMLNGKEITVENPDPSKTLVDFLRYDMKLTGTKVGCAEGGCGVCSVVGSRGEGFTPVAFNSCLRPLCSMDGWSITTVEGLRKPGTGCCRSKALDATAYHPIQRKIADGNGVQCGFCTPGWVMTMYAALEKNKSKGTLDAAEIEHNFDGNLCRCTGYRPILQSFHDFATPSPLQAEDRHRSVHATLQKTKNGDDPVRRFVSEDKQLQWYAVSSLQQLSDLCKSEKASQTASFVCSSTAVRGIKKYYEGRGGDPVVLPPVSIDVSRIAELNLKPSVQQGPSGQFLKVGAAIPIAEVIDALEADGIAGILKTHISRIAGHQVRNVGTWAGNIGFVRSKPAFASDMAPALSALGTKLTVFSTSDSQQQEMAVEDFVWKAGSNVLIVDGQIPLPAETSGSVVSIFRCYKAAQRHVNSHSIVNACFLVTIDQKAKTFLSARLFFGALAGGLMRANQTEKALQGQPIQSTKLIDDLVAALSLDIEAAGGLTPGAVYSKDFCMGLAKAHIFRLLLSALDKIGALPAENASALSAFATIFSRPVLKALQAFDVPKEEAPVGEAIPKLTAILSASGEAMYPSDRFADVSNVLYGALVYSSQANCKLVSVDPSPALAMDGVVDVLTAADYPRGHTLQYGEPMFYAAGETVPCQGAPVAFVVARSLRQALAATVQVRQVWATSSVAPITDLQAAREQNTVVPMAQRQEAVQTLHKTGSLRQRRLPLHQANFSASRKDDMPALSGSMHQVTGEVKTGGQLHFYMEPQTCIATPDEEGSLEIWVGTQWPDWTQKSICQLLDIPAHKVNIKVRRVGGGFGGKITRQCHIAGACSIAALKLRQPVFASNERVADMRMTTGREETDISYTASCDDEGRLQSLHMDCHVNVGYLGTDAEGDIAMMINFSDNAFYCPDFKCNGTAYNSHTMPRTSARAPGVIQSVTAHGVVLEHIAMNLGLDFEWVQEQNFYKAGQKTPFGDVIGSATFNWTLPDVWNKLRKDSNFDQRREGIVNYNAANRWRKRGLAMTPIKYGMGLEAYTTSATVNIYSDGTVLVSHGGCEIGQGIHTKVAQVAANALRIDMSMIRIGDTTTDKIPNGVVTGGSGTSETCAQAAKLACEELYGRLKPYLDSEKDWKKAVSKAIGSAVNMSAIGFSTFQAEEGGINTYATYGAAASEVEIDVLTGEMEIRRVDILMDLGNQLNAAIDIGQLEGGFVMALGYFFTEQALFGSDGTFLNIGTWEYKIPSYCDVPQEFNVSLMNPAVPNPAGVMGSKASAEPPMSLAASAYFAVKSAIYAARSELGQGKTFFPLPIPSTVEEIQKACGVATKDLRI